MADPRGAHAQNPPVHWRHLFRPVRPGKPRDKTNHNPTSSNARTPTPAAYRRPWWSMQPRCTSPRSHVRQRRVRWIQDCARQGVSSRPESGHRWGNFRVRAKHILWPRHWLRAATRFFPICRWDFRSLGCHPTRLPWVAVQSAALWAPHETERNDAQHQESEKVSSFPLTNSIIFQDGLFYQQPVYIPMIFIP